ncbi:MAG: hypothetical protein KBT58_12285 [Bizionia sp.]|nr:hypothetical protein [Bizionia sp.]
MTKQLLNYNKEAEQRFIKRIEAVPELLEQVKAELTAQKVDHNLKLSDLKKGNFISIFENYHKKEMKQYVPKADYSKYLDLLNVNTDELEKLENIYKKYLDLKESFYSVNNDYWFSKETFGNDFERVKHPEAPTKKEYCIDDFLKISLDSYKITVDSELFKLYFTNKQQTNELNDAKQQIQLAKRRKSDRRDVLKVVGDIVRALDNEYNITWNYEKILDIK